MRRMDVAICLGCTPDHIDLHELTFLLIHGGSDDGVRLFCAKDEDGEWL